MYHTPCTLIAIANEELEYSSRRHREMNHKRVEARDAGHRC